MSPVRPLAALLLALAPVVRAAPAEPVAEAARAVVAACDVDPALGWVVSCPGDELARLEAALDGGDALAGLAAVLEDADPAARALAADRLALAFPEVVTAPEAVSAGLVDDLLGALSGLTPYGASRLAPVIGGAARRAGGLEAALERLGGAAGPRVLAHVPAALVALGDTGALATLAGHAAPEVAAAALHAAADAQAEVDAEVCERGVGLLDHADPRARVAAARVVARCRPQAVREAVADGDRSPARRTTLLWALYEARPDAETLAVARSARSAEAPLGARANAIALALVEVHGVEEEAEEERPAVPAGTYTGRVRGTASGTLRFEIRGGRVTDASARLGGARLPLRGELKGTTVRLTGSSGGNYARFRGRVRPGGAASGSWTGGISRRVSKGTWTASR